MTCPGPGLGWNACPLEGRGPNSPPVGPGRGMPGCPLADSGCPCNGGGMFRGGGPGGRW